MNLSKKILLFNILLALLITGFALVYLLGIMPSLYLEKLDEKNIENTKNILEYYREKREFPKSLVSNLSFSIIAESEKNSNLIKLSNSNGFLEIEVKDKDLIEILDYFKSLDSMDKDTVKNPKFTEEYISSILKDKIFNINNEAFEVKRIESGNLDSNQKKSIKIFSENKALYILATVEDENNIYTSHFGLVNDGGKLIISLNPYSTSKIGDIRSIVFESLAMILGVIFVITFLFSQFLSKSIARPIDKLAKHIEWLSSKKDRNIERINLKSGDEIADLGESIDHMYEKLMEAYKELEDKNKKQELFLKTSSHQLKTPLAASLLLTRSMIDKLGKYGDRDRFLPDLEKQLEEMKITIGRLNMLNKLSKDKEIRRINLKELTLNILSRYSLLVEDKKIKEDFKGKEIFIESDEFYLTTIIDNLISNAVEHSKEGSNLKIILEEKELIIINHAHIDGEIIENIFEPFVTSKKASKSGGLGLYIAKKYADSLSYDLSMTYQEEVIEMRLKF